LQRINARPLHNLEPTLAAPIETIRQGRHAHARRQRPAYRDSRARTDRQGRAAGVPGEAAVLPGDPAELPNSRAAY
jgi:hypothetical protein